MKDRFHSKRKSDDSLSCGVIGLGRSGWDIHIRCINEVEETSLSCVCDSNSERLDKALENLDCKGYTDYNDVISDPEVDIVIVATPSSSHFQIARDALKAKKHVVLEKPITSSIDEAIELKEISIENRRLLIPFFNFRFADEFLKIKSILKEGMIGSPFLIKRQVSYFNRRDDWQSQSTQQGGILNAAAIHHIDQVLQLVGDQPIDLWTDLRRVVSKGDAPDHCKILMKFSNGCVADIEVSWAMALKDRKPWQIFGPKGAIIQSNNSITYRWFDERDCTEEMRDDRSYFSNEKINWKVKEYTLEDDYALGIAPILYSKIADSINCDSEIPITIDSALITMEVMNKIENYL